MPPINNEQVEDFYVVADPETGSLLSFCNTSRITNRYYRAARFTSTEEAAEVFDTIKIPEEGEVISCKEYLRRGYVNKGQHRSSKNSTNSKKVYLLKKKNAFSFFSRTNKRRLSQQPATADIFFSKDDAKAVIRKYNLKGYQVHTQKHYLKRTGRGKGRRNYLLQERNSKLFVSMCNIKARTQDLKKAAFFETPEEAAGVASKMNWYNLQLVSRSEGGKIMFPKKKEYVKSNHIDSTAYFSILLEGKFPSRNICFFGRSSQDLTTAVVRNADIFSSFKRAEEVIKEYELNRRFKKAIPIPFAEAVKTPTNKRERSVSDLPNEYLLQDTETGALFSFATPNRLTVSRVRAARFLSEKEKDDVIESLGDRWSLKPLLKNVDSIVMPSLKPAQIRVDSAIRSQCWVIRVSGSLFFSRIKRGRFCTFSYEADVFHKHTEAESVATYYNLSNYEIVRLADLVQYKEKETKASFQSRTNTSQDKVYLLQYPDENFYTMSELNRKTKSLPKAAVFSTWYDAKQHQEEFYLNTLNIVEVVPENRNNPTSSDSSDNNTDRSYILEALEAPGYYYARSSLSREVNDLAYADRFALKEDATEELPKARQDTGHTFRIVRERELRSVFSEGTYDRERVHT